MLRLCPHHQRRSGKRSVLSVICLPGAGRGPWPELNALDMDLRGTGLAERNTSSAPGLTSVHGSRPAPGRNCNSYPGSGWRSGLKPAALMSAVSMSPRVEQASAEVRHCCTASI